MENQNCGAAGQWGGEAEDPGLWKLQGTGLEQSTDSFCFALTM